MLVIKYTLSVEVIRRDANISTEKQRNTIPIITLKGVSSKRKLLNRLSAE